ncbi:MAG: hypothetical protein ACTH9B_15640, partial [Brevibacterium aurantiacum]
MTVASKAVMGACGTDAPSSLAVAGNSVRPPRGEKLSAGGVVQGHQPVYVNLVRIAFPNSVTVISMRVRVPIGDDQLRIGQSTAVNRPKYSPLN